MSDTLFSFVRPAAADARQLVPAGYGQVFRRVIRSARRRVLNAQKCRRFADLKVGPEIALNIAASTFDVRNKE